MIEKSGNIKFAWRKVPTTYKNKKMALILFEVTYYRLVVGAHAILTLQAMKRKVESFCEKHLINDRNNNIWPISCKNSLINLILLSRYYLWIAFLALFFCHCYRLLQTTHKWLDCELFGWHNGLSSFHLKIDL